MKYKGAQESEAHRRLKSLIERSLRADPRFEDVHVEATWRGTRDPATLRRPDVQARFAGQRLAFEAQLTTTFLDVVISRKAFYRSESSLLIWVLPHFDPQYRQLTVDDLLFNNNANVLVIDRASTETSEASGRFTVRCTYRRPLLHDSVLTSTWESRLVAWDDLTIDAMGQRIFAFDCEGEERALVDHLAEADKTERMAADYALRVTLLDILTERGAKFRAAGWGALRERFAARGFVLAGDYEPDQGLRNIVCGVMSALAGKPIGYGFEKLVQVAHHVADRFPEALLPFGHALRASGNHVLVQAQDKHGHWERKARTLRAAIKAGDPSYWVSPDTAALLAFLFPELVAQLGGSASVRHH